MKSRFTVYLYINSFLLQSWLRITNEAILTMTQKESTSTYSPKSEARNIFNQLLKLRKELNLPEDVKKIAEDVQFTSSKDIIYFPIPFKETETTAALKGLEALVATVLTNLKYGEMSRKIEIDLEHTTCFLFQTYLSTIDNLGKYDPGIKAKLKGWLNYHIHNHIY